MSSIPSNLSRVPNLLASQIMLGSLTRTQHGLLNTQIQLATGKQVNRPSDDVVAASTISVLDDLIERREQRLRNLSHAEAVMNNIDSVLGEAGSIVMEARSIGLSQIGVGSDATTREMEAVVIDAMIDQLTSIANRKHQQVHLFGGAATSNAPMVGLLNGYQYVGQGEGLHTDLGMALSMPITLSAERAFGTMSTRVQGKHDLQVMMTGAPNATRLADLAGARGEGIQRGAINIDVDGTKLSVDLSSAHSVQDVIDALEQAIQEVDAGATVGISADGRSFAIEPSAGVDITISDTVGEATAADLGLAMTFPGGVNSSGADVQPKLTQQTRITSLAALTEPLGQIRLSNGGKTHDLDLSSAETIGDIQTAVHALNMGIRVEIDSENGRLNFINELSAGIGKNGMGGMSIGEVGGGTTATQLGVRTFAGSTNLADLNHGMGVEIRSGSVDPVTGDPKPEADLDFRITLKDGGFFEVDLAGAETIQDVIDAINAAALAEGYGPPDFEAALAADGNGIVLNDATGPVGETTSVVALNGSFAAEHLGILGSTTGATLTGEDRATVAVDSVISHLMSLRDALRANDESGISLATSKLEQDLDRLTQARAETGARARRVLDAKQREEDLQIQDRSLKSQLQDLDYTEAAIRFSMLQQQLQAGLQTAGFVNSLSLLDFLR